MESRLSDFFEVIITLTIGLILTIGSNYLSGLVFKYWLKYHKMEISTKPFKYAFIFCGVLFLLAGITTLIKLLN